MRRNWWRSSWPRSRNFDPSASSWKDGVEPAALAVERHAVALQVAEMGKGGLAAGAAHLHHPRLDDDAARPEAHAAFGQAPAVLAREAGCELGASAARIEAAGPRRGAPRPPDAARIAAGTGDGAIDLLEETLRPARPAIATAARAAQARLEAGVVIAGHGEDIRRESARARGLQPPPERGRRSICYGKWRQPGFPQGATLAPQKTVCRQALSHREMARTHVRFILLSLNLPPILSPTATTSADSDHAG